MGFELQPLIKPLAFHDIDEPADRIKEFKWNMVHQQLESGAFAGDLLVAQLADMRFARLAYNRGIRSGGNSPRRMLVIAVPLSVPEALKWHGHSLLMDHVILQKSAYGADFLRRGTFQLALTSVDIATLLSAADATNQPQVESLIFGNAHVVQPDAIALKQFRCYFQHLFTLIQRHPQRALQPEMQTFIRKKAIPIMLNVLTPNNHVSKLHPSSRYQLMKQAEEMLLENIDRPWTVHDLCMALHVSERTLRYSFQEYFGMAPMTYLKIQRLNGVRRQLKASTTDQVTVTNVAVQWGFWHMGQFAKDYKKMFGECPSETLRNDS